MSSQTTRTVRMVTTVGMALLASVSFAAGVPAGLWAGHLAGFGAMAAAAPATIDGALVLLAAAWSSQRRDGEPARGWATATAVTVTVSAALQVAHAHSVTTAVGPVELAVAMVVGGLPAIVTLTGVHAGLELLTGKPRKRGVAARSEVPAEPTRDSSAVRRISDRSMPARPPIPTRDSKTGGEAPTYAASRAAQPAEVRRRTKPRAAGAKRERTPQLAAEVERLAAEGLGRRAIAVRTGASASMVQRILEGANEPASGQLHAVG